MTDIKKILREAINHLTLTSNSPAIDAEILLAYTLKTSRTFLYTHPEHKLEVSQAKVYLDLVMKRCQGLPIAYLIEEREFWSLPLYVNEHTLIPRHETELLVELTLDLLKNVSEATILELGTGSGAIALALAKERPDWKIIAVDINKTTVEIARENANRLGLSNVHIYVSNWFSSIPPTQFNAIVSNPPYLTANDPHLNEGDLRFEPKQALIAGHNGLEALTSIIQASYDYLLPQGLLLLEHGFEQKEAVLSLLNDHGYQKVQCWQDWQHHDRVSGGWHKL